MGSGIFFEHPESGSGSGLMMPKAGNDEIYGKMAELAKNRRSLSIMRRRGDRIENNRGKRHVHGMSVPDGKRSFQAGMKNHWYSGSLMTAFP